MAENRTNIPIWVDNTRDRIRQLKWEAELEKRAHNKAVIMAQKYVRGYLTRKHMRFLHGCATVIQKHFRGFKARKTLNIVTFYLYREMNLYFYHNMATKIQAYWKGYQQRKKFDYYKLRKWIKDTELKNFEVMNQMRAFQSDENLRLEKELVAEYQIWIEYMAQKLHHLIRTRCIPGIYSRRDSTKLSEIEEFLNKFDFTNFLKDIKDKRAQTALSDILTDHNKQYERNNCIKRLVTRRCLEALKASATISNPVL